MRNTILSIKFVLNSMLFIWDMSDNFIMDLKKTFGQNIQKYRKFQKLTQEKLAEIVGIDTTSISAIENGKYFVSAETLNKLALALKVNVSDLFDNNNSCEVTYNEILQLLEVLKEDKSRLNALKNFIKVLI